MSAPPGYAPNIDVGGSWHTDKAKKRDAAIAAAHLALQESGVAMSASKVARLVAKFDRLAGRGRTFHEFIVREAELPSVAVRRLLAHPEWHRVVAYSDPTGETAVNNVMRGSRG